MKCPNDEAVRRRKDNFPSVLNRKEADYTIKAPEDYMTFLKCAGQGCISGMVSEWPQLYPACKWAAEEIARLRGENAQLHFDRRRRYKLLPFKLPGSR